MFHLTKLGIWSFFYYYFTSVILRKLQPSNLCRFDVPLSCYYWEDWRFPSKMEADKDVEGRRKALKAEDKDRRKGNDPQMMHAEK